MTPSIPGKKPRRSRKSEILNCFAEMVADRGYDMVSLRDIASELNMSKGTILHHFGSKEAMMERVHAEYMERRLAEIKLILERLKSPPARLSAVVHQNMVGTAEDRIATVAFAREILRFAAEDSMKEVRSMRAEYAGIVTGIVREGIASGAFVEADPDITSLQVFGMCNWAWTWYQPGGKWTPDEIADQFVKTLMSGLLADGQGTGGEMGEVARTVRDTMAEVRSSQTASL